MSRKAVLAGAALVLACAGVTGGAFADRLSDASDKIREALEQAAKDDGYSIVGEIRFGQIDEVDDEIFTFKVDPAKTYVAYGACDAHCSEFSLGAREKGGKFIDNSSGQDNDHPLIAIDDFKGDEITIEANMYECDDEPCVFGIALAESGKAEDAKTGRTAAEISSLAELLIGGSFSSKPDNSNRSAAEPASDAELVDMLQKRGLDFLDRLGDIEIGRLATGEAMRFFFETDPQKVHEIFAMCDGCGNLDVTAHDDDDRRVGADTASDNRPVAEIVPDGWPASRRAAPQKLIVEVHMVDCPRTTCGFSIGVYREK